MNKCPNCPTVPIVSVRLATKIFPAMSSQKRMKALLASFEWLTKRDEGLSLYNGVNGREYTNDEKKAISFEASTVAGFQCPFWSGKSCSIGGLGPHYNRVEETQAGQYGWAPLLLARELDRQQLKELASRCAIADAKIALLSRNEAI